MWFTWYELIERKVYILSLFHKDRLYLYVDLIVSGSMYGTIQAKPHYGYSFVNIKSAEGDILKPEK